MVEEGKVIMNGKDKAEAIATIVEVHSSGNLNPEEISTRQKTWTKYEMDVQENVGEDSVKWIVYSSGAE